MEKTQVPGSDRWLFQSNHLSTEKRFPTQPNKPPSARTPPFPNHLYPEENTETGRECSQQPTYDCCYL